MLSERTQIIVRDLPLAEPGIEIAPYFNPVVPNDIYPVLYTDCVEQDVIDRKAAENPSLQGRLPPRIDFVWKPGHQLSSVCPAGALFSYAVASHVIEHVPDTLGWINSIFDVLHVGARVALVVPDRRRTLDFYRQETTPADLIDSWLRRPALPTARQVFDFMSGIVDDSGEPGTRSFETGTPAHEAPAYYDKQDAFRYAMHSWAHGEYLDVHCTVWTPESFVHCMVTSTQHGLINAHICEPIELENEFVIHLIKNGKPHVSHPGRQNALSRGS